ncbi:MAG: phosphoenolpyruvate carboxykinase (GTP), partial [Clostridia bacterium]|nr:phosphoenolpyruvate carboxykinase (GTP) [Clostridia bacterium]
GFVPKAEDINVEGLDITVDTVRDLLNVDADLWKEEAAGIADFYAQIGDRVPKELYDELDALKARLG